MIRNKARNNIMKNKENSLKTYRKNKWQNAVQTSDSGRSMVEMLCVLAVVGMLSIICVVGYQMMLIYYRANDIAKEVSMRHVDIKNIYQFKDLPAELTTDWASKTNTGYSIEIVPFPPKVFEVRIYGVQSNVCKRLLNMGLHDSNRKVYVVDEEDTSINLVSRQEFMGDTAICGENNAKNMIFIATTMEILGETSFCLENADCSTCDECVDNMCQVKEGYQGAVEATCNGNIKKCCPLGQALLANCTCKGIQRFCASDEFRTANGSCETCDTNYNPIVLNEPFSFELLDIHDTVSGVEMCNACPDREKALQTLNGDWVCSNTCVAGISVQMKSVDSEGRMCYPCLGSDGNPNTTITEIVNDEVAKQQCLACRDANGNATHTWWRFVWEAKTYCGPKVNCAAGTQFMTSANSCSSCTDNREQGVQMVVNNKSPDITEQDIVDTCNGCNDARWVSDAFGVGSSRRRYCNPVCMQPADGGEICKTSPSSESCTRKWQTWDGNCYDCDYNGSASTITKWGSVGGTVIDNLKTLCELCGRQVNNLGYCVASGSSLSLGKFMGADGALYDCSNGNGIVIDTVENSGCLANCAKTGDVYIENGEIQTREIYKTSDNITYCIPTCEGGLYSFYHKRCDTCPTTYKYVYGTTEAYCSRCENAIFWNANQCAPKTCPNNHFRHNYGSCASCSDDSAFRVNKFGQDQKCNECGNRLVLEVYGDSGYYHCVKINPGISGVCNSKTTLPAGVSEGKLNESILKLAQPYWNGEHDGTLILGGLGNCYSCDSTSVILTSAEQCGMCENRRYDSSTQECSLGLCTDGKAFLNTDKECVSCTDTALQTAILHNSSARASCDSCSGKRSMIVGAESFCVNKCSETGEFQTALGICETCTSVGSFDIGSDEVSQTLCTNCGKTPVCTIDEEIKITTCTCE